MTPVIVVSHRSSAMFLEAAGPGGDCRHLAIGKKFFDKRQDLRKEDQQREMDRAMNRKR